MKTLVLQLDRSEDAGSIRDKVTWGKASRVLLVWPVNFLLLDRKIDLVTIKRICTSQGSRLGIICDIPEVIAEAEELQIPVFDTVNRAMRKSWDRRKQRKPGGYSIIRETGGTGIEDLRIAKYSLAEFWKLNETARIAIFFLAVISVFSLLFFLFPSAKVSIYPQGRESKMQIVFRVFAGNEKTSAPGMLNAEKKSITAKGETTFPTSGSLNVPEKNASGSVTLTNLTQKEVVIPEGTVVKQRSSPPLRYKIMEAVTLPEEEAIAGIKITAIEAGEGGNAEPNTITSLDGSLGLLVEVTNPDPITGGTSKSYQAVSEDDVNLAAEKLEQILKTQAEVEFSKTLGDQDILLSSSIQMDKVVEQSEQPEVGQAGMLLKLKQSVEYSVMVINREDLEKQAEMILQANQVIEDWEYSIEKPVEVQILAQEYDKESGFVNMKTSVSKLLTPPIDSSFLRTQISGKSKVRANEILNGSVLNAKSPEITTMPEWLPFLPLLSSRILIEVR